MQFLTNLDHNITVSISETFQGHAHWSATLISAKPNQVHTKLKYVGSNVFLQWLLTHLTLSKSFSDDRYEGCVTNTSMSPLDAAPDVKNSYITEIYYTRSLSVTIHILKCFFLIRHVTTRGCKDVWLTCYFRVVTHSGFHLQTWEMKPSCTAQ